MLRYIRLWTHSTSPSRDPRMEDTPHLGRAASRQSRSLTRYGVVPPVQQGLPFQGSTIHPRVASQVDTCDGYVWLPEGVATSKAPSCTSPLSTLMPTSLPSLPLSMFGLVAILAWFWFYTSTRGAGNSERRFRRANWANSWPSTEEPAASETVFAGARSGTHPRIRRISHSVSKRPRSHRSADPLLFGIGSQACLCGEGDSLARLIHQSVSTDGDLGIGLRGSMGSEGSDRMPERLSAGAPRS